MFFAALTWWMFIQGERDEELLTLSTLLSVVETTAELSALGALFLR